MLEVRSAYGYYGEAGGVTGENPPQQMTAIRMPYRDYKKKYCNTHDRVADSYDPVTKTIEVLFSSEEVRGNLGKRYRMDYFWFLVENYEAHYVYEGKRIETVVMQVYAKTYENAERNIRKRAKQEGFDVIREATPDDCKAYRHIWVR